MEEDAVKKIKEGDFEGARKIILEMEDGIRIEPSLYGRRVLLEKVARLKKIYNDHNRAEIGTIPFRSLTSFERRENKVDGIKDKRYIKGSRDELVTIEDCVEVVIEDCTNAVFEHFCCEKSVVLNNVKDCKVSCSAHQIRMNGCRNVELEAYTLTGVFLQNSTGIVVRRYGGRKDNRFKNVNDFSSPFESINYTVLPDGL
ncbi:uncharacterized protein Eint_081780 [Encephalitozoon intestinalis ATCC 50506]|uniref:C-CAP/cofactor C-like domain-containing protein n=1 Tax=Encephalitozoon intestinalis (strain ATCC 50506) TaxID=876142 RepID=E0S8A4_ENCIT|nr:uncharacterized protein Eint_081780 [Encephalitozoon intestinalis ATCC 50506]ADM12110.1 hypothetical protein Eint_081780 [Encephalitozoon intestinalis ATCC 50506]UTX45902.1 tubulin binding cofactor C [Encephalitozoon intestinalis]